MQINRVVSKKSGALFVLPARIRLSGSNFTAQKPIIPTMSEPTRSTSFDAPSSGVSTASASPYQVKHRSRIKPFDVFWAGVAVSFVCVAAVALYVQNWQGINPLIIGIFLLIALASELLPVTLAEGNAEITLTPIIYWGVVALFGPGYGVIVAFSAAFLGSLIYKQIFQRNEGTRAGFWQYLIYNSCCIGLHAGAGALLYTALGGPRMIDINPEMQGVANVIPPLIIATFFSLALDLSLFATGSAIVNCDDDGECTLEMIWMMAKVIWVKSIIGFLPNYLMFTPFAFVLAYLFIWRSLGFLGVLPILVPFFSMRHALKLVMESVQAYRQTITTLAMLMQKYHPYTRGHLKRVADLSLRLARELRLPASSQQWIWEAGLLHDIGKVGVSEQILDKTERLTEEEWDIIKAHPVSSAEILDQLEFLDPLVPWVRHHHERVDGHGYPDGLKEGEIPIEAEIIAVADAFDAMTGTRSLGEGKNRSQCDACEWKPSDGAPMPEECPECGATLIRVYRKPMTIEDGIRQLRLGVGTQFSGRVVRGFIRMMAREGVEADDQ